MILNSIIILMGSCRSFPKYRVVTARSLFSDTKDYKYKVLCKVKKRNPHGKIINFHDLELTLNRPQLITSYKVELLDDYIWTSSCIIPEIKVGIMPPRTSQDFCTILNEDNILFVALFDGYGIKGDKVSEVCVSES